MACKKYNGGQKEETIIFTVGERARGDRAVRRWCGEEEPADNEGKDILSKGTHLHQGSFEGPQNKWRNIVYEAAGNVVIGQKTKALIAWQRVFGLSPISHEEALGF